jgi:D-tyrosyl-tRNA(Tyr) deacylase
MKLVVQRVSKAAVHIDHNTYAEIGSGLCILLGIEEDDGDADADWLAVKVAGLRIFADQHGLMNLSIQDIQGELLVISQFTLFASTKKGNRPSFIRSAKPEKAIPLYEYFIAILERNAKLPVKTGIFGADMQIELINDGPVTIIIDSKNKV